MPILSIRHVTRYRYRNPVALGEHRMMFRPREDADQRLLSWELEIDPVPKRLRFVQDVFGNSIGVAAFDGCTRELSFESRVNLEHRPEAPFVGGAPEIEADHEQLPDLSRSKAPLHVDPDGVVARWARRFVGPSDRVDLAARLSEMTWAIHRSFQYATRLERGPQSPLETLELRRGSCRDFAVLMIDAVRSLGLAARFVSGYIHCPGPIASRRTGGGHTHAWVSVYLPGRGWVDFDPTNGLVGADGLVRVAVVREPSQALPLHGTWSGRAGDFLGMEVEVDVHAVADLSGQPPLPLAVAVAS